MMPLILKIDDPEQPWGHGLSIPGDRQASEGHQARIGFLARRLGTKKLGSNPTVLAPGKREFPFHCHSVNELRYLGRAGESLDHWRGE